MTVRRSTTSTKISARRGAPSDAGPRSDARSITLRCTAAGGARDSPPNVPGRSRFDTARAAGVSVAECKTRRAPRTWLRRRHGVVEHRSLERLRAGALRVAARVDVRQRQAHAAAHSSADGAPVVDHLVQQLIDEDEVLAQRILRQRAAVVLRPGRGGARQVVARAWARQRPRALMTRDTRCSSSSTSAGGRLSREVATKSRPAACGGRAGA